MFSKPRMSLCSTGYNLLLTAFFLPFIFKQDLFWGLFQYFKHFLIRILYWSGKIIWLQCSSTNRSHGNRICSETSYVWGERSTRPSLTEKRVFKESISKRYRPTGTILFLHIWSQDFNFILNLDHCVKTQEKNKNSCTNMCRTLWFFFWFWLKSSTDDTAFRLLKYNEKQLLAS